MTHRILVALLLMLQAALPAVAQAACLSDADVAALLAAYNAKTPAANPEGLSAADMAGCD